jgi:hypothetical protein
MQFDIADAVRTRAKNAHELFILNLIAFHLLLAPAAIALGIGEWGLLLTPLFSLPVLGFIFLRARRAESRDPWFIMVHWKIAVQRSKLLLASYGVTAAILLLVFLLTGSVEHSMRQILITVFTRVGVMPVVITVFVCFVLESSALYQAGKGEVPDGMLRRHPAPADVKAVPGPSE